MIHPSDCDCDTYGCQLRRKGIMLSYDASPTRRARRPWRPKVDASHNAGLVTESRPGGTVMPVLDASGRKIRTKEGRERRREIDEFRRARHQGAQLFP
jgi:hypothetical protein